MPDLDIIKDLMLQAQYFLIPVYLMVWVLKKYVKVRVPKLIWAISAVILGIVINGAYVMLTGGDFMVGVTAGLLTGLESTQIWQVWKHLLEDFNDEG